MTRSELGAIAERLRTAFADATIESIPADELREFDAAMTALNTAADRLNASCSWRRHDWGRWESVQVRFNVEGSRAGVTTKQVRECERCGLQRIKGLSWVS